MRRRCLAASLFLVLLAGLGLRAGGHVAAGDEKPPPARFVGASACSGCHGMTTARKEPPFLDEYATWSATDPETGLPQDLHSYAYIRLYDARAGEIEERLAARGGAPVQASSDVRCLTCHGVAVLPFGKSAPSGGLPVEGRKDLQGARYDPEDGVSCDGCHGPAEKRLSPHAERGWAAARWKALGSAGLYDEWGFYYTKDLALWALECASCHVAIAPELLDADHPDLGPFELDALSRAMPVHWRDYEAADPARADLPAPGPFHGVRVWQTGQAVALEHAALELARRAAPAVDARPRSAGPKLARVAEAFERLRSHHGVLRHALARAAPEAGAALDAAMKALAPLLAAEKPPLEKVAERALAVAAAARPVPRALADFRADAAYARAVVRAIVLDEAALLERAAARQTAFAVRALYTSYERNAKPPGGDALFMAIAELEATAFEPASEGYRDALERIRGALR